MLSRLSGPREKCIGFESLASPSMGVMSLSPHPTHGETDLSRTKIFKYWSFLQSKPVNYVCKLLQPLGASGPPYPLPGLRPWTALGDFGLTDSLAIAPKWKFLASPLAWTHPEQLHPRYRCPAGTPTRTHPWWSELILHANINISVSILGVVIVRTLRKINPSVYKCVFIFNEILRTLFITSMPRLSSCGWRWRHVSRR